MKTKNKLNVKNELTQPFLHPSGFVDRENILNYSSNRERLVNRRKGEDFANAVKQMDEYISNPMVAFFG